MSTVSGTKRSDVERLSELPSEVAIAVASFVTTFERWARSLASADAPSYPRLRLLNCLECDGPQRMSDLADALEVTPRSVTALVDGLEAEGLVRRQPHPTDRRVTIVESTDKASGAADQFQLHHAGLARLFATLSSTDQRDMLRLTKLLENRMRASVSDGPIDSNS